MPFIEFNPNDKNISNAKIGSSEKEDIGANIEKLRALAGKNIGKTNKSSKEDEFYETAENLSENCEDSTETTDAIGEEGGLIDLTPSTDALGEEGGGSQTTMAMGEEGGLIDLTPSTDALGEEGGVIGNMRETTDAIGEEGGLIGNMRETTDAIGEEGGGIIGRHK